MATWSQLRVRFWVCCLAVCLALVLCTGMPGLARAGDLRPLVGQLAFLGTLISICGLAVEGLFRVWRKYAH